MSGLWAKLNLKEQKEILVLNAPESFAATVDSLRGVRVNRRLTGAEEVTFVLAFVAAQAELDELSLALVRAAAGDAILWFAYPKGTSKRYRCEFNRDTGWGILRSAGFDTVRQVAIDEDWSALRFRRLEFIKRRATD